MGFINAWRCKARDSTPTVQQDNLKTLIRIATAFNMTIVEFLNVPEIIEFSEDDLEDESEKNEGQEETDKALREVVHRGE